MTRKRRLLLVDDDPNVVDGLQRFLRRYRETMTVTTANSAGEALTKMKDTVFDVIVTDMRMPVMDGAAFLAIAKRESPATMRIVLSGQTDPEAALRALPVAHQFLSKPTDAAVLYEQIMRLAATHDMISDSRVRAAMGEVDALPSGTTTYHELNRLLADEDVSLGAIAELVEGEPAIVLKLLQLANSAFFGGGRRILDVGDAISYLGTDLVKTLVLSIGVVNGLPVRATRFDADAFHTHVQRVAHMAKHIEPPGERAHVIFAAALLHDVGALVVASMMPELYDGIVARTEENGSTIELEERASLGCGRTQIGAALLDMWGLPYPIVETIISFQAAPLAPTSTLRAGDVLYLAHRLVDDAGHELATDEDRTYLEALGVTDRLPAWRDFATGLKAA